MLAFFVLACTVAAISAAVYEEPAAMSESRETERSHVLTTEEKAPEPETEPSTEQLSADIPSDATFTYLSRTDAPEEDNRCYYSNENIFYAADYGMPNCTCYAWGRAYELLGHRPALSPWDACTWYDYNRENDIYDYGQEPQLGAIACWAYADGGSGHVAVVEDIGEDTVTCSNSAYEGTTFYMDTLPINDPSDGRENWIFQGYIYVNEAA